MITLGSQISLSNEVLVQEIEGEAVLLDLKSEQYFGLDAIGVKLWRSLESGASLQRAHQELLSQYEVEPDVLADDLVSLLEALERAGLIVVEN